jgi:hypothetical protein
MRDEMDARAWNEHHDQFSEWVGEFLAAATRFRLPGLQVSGQLLAALTALSITIITFGGTAA